MLLAYVQSTVVYHVWFIPSMLGALAPMWLQNCLGNRIIASLDLVAQFTESSYIHVDHNVALTPRVGL